MPTDLARRLISQLDRGIRAIEGDGECAEPLCCSYMHDLVAKANAERDVTWRELDRARAQRDALNHALEQIGEVATATYTKHGATAAQRLELISKIIADAIEVAG
jgi:hemerythrin superfamily protein